MILPGLELGTTSVLDWCDNQLHHKLHDTFAHTIEVI